MKPLLLDLFCGAGGASRGYADAGFDVMGVDITPQPRYPYPFIQGDALALLGDLLMGKTVQDNSGQQYTLVDFSAIHASPPCQAYSKVKGLACKNYPMLIEPTRAALIASGKPYVIENTEGAPLLNPTLLCGMMFGLDLYRHRLFETSFSVPFLWDFGHGLDQDKLVGKSRQREICLVVGKGQYKGYRIRASAAMGIDWMLEEELAEAIPPAYTKFIGAHLMQYVITHVYPNRAD